jgi:hypothetical protein
MFKREVEKWGIECCIMQYGDKIEIKTMRKIVGKYERLMKEVL